jgi:hypothetical protein
MVREADLAESGAASTHVDLWRRSAAGGASASRGCNVFHRSRQSRCLPIAASIADVSMIADQSATQCSGAAGDSIANAVAPSKRDTRPSVAR